METGKNEYNSIDQKQVSGTYEYESKSNNLNSNNQQEKSSKPIKEGTGIAGTDISGEDSANENSGTSKSFDQDQKAIGLGLDDGDLDNDVDRRNNELI
jgi:hypothetical protein